MESELGVIHNDIHSPIQLICENVKRECKADFAGIAFQAKKSQKIGWQYAAGNRNEKFRRMEVRYGKGVAGRVIATGRPVEISSFPDHIEGKAVDYPIMLAEHMVCVWAMPVYIEGLPKGAFLIGRRTSQPFSVNEHIIVQNAAEKLEGLLKENLLPDLEGE
jgi:nitrogen regulatory protein A